MCRHSKGPWISCNDHVDDSNGVPIFRSTRSFADLNCADFHLAASAPMLLTACEKLIDWHNRENSFNSDRLDECVDFAALAIRQYKNRLQDSK